MSKTFTTSVPIIGRVRACLEFIKSEEIKGKKIVDIGASFGWLEDQLGKEKATLIGIEPNEEAVKFANKNFVGKAHFLVGNALNIPVKDNQADIAILFDVIEHVPQSTEPKVLEEISRILKKSGVLLLTTPNSHWFANLLDPAWYFGHRHYTFNKIESLIREAGFEIEDHRIRGGYFSVMYMVWFYFTKWVLRIVPKNSYLEDIDDRSYNSASGITTHFIKAKKL